MTITTNTPKAPVTKTAVRAVVVTTENRGVFFGYVRDESMAPAQITLERVRNCVYWPMQGLPWAHCLRAAQGQQDRPAGASRDAV